jgi:hypothetical protein
MWMPMPFNVGTCPACVFLTSTQTLTNKTLTTPTIASFLNAAHNHSNAAGGGQLTDVSLSAPVGTAKGGTGVNISLATAGRFLRGGGTVFGLSAGFASGTGACGVNTWVSTLNDDAAPTCTQPDFTNLSGAATDAQVPDTITVTLAAAATNLAADPTDCGTGDFATTIGANGNLTCSRPVGYVLQVFTGNTASITDPTTLYAGSLPLSFSTTAAFRRIYIPKTGTVKAVYGTFVQTAGATTETSTLSFLLKDATDTLVSDTAISSTIANDQALNAFSNTGLAIAVTAGYYFELKWVTPTWTTNPTNVSLSAVIYIE